MRSFCAQQFCQYGFRYRFKWNVGSRVCYCYQRVNHVVVCGHYSCGVVKVAMQSAYLVVLNPWLRNIRDVYRLHKTELNDIDYEEKKYDRLVELNVQEQCVNLIITAAIHKAYRDRGLIVHGCVYDIKTGKLIDLKIDFDAIPNNIMEIYKGDCLKSSHCDPESFREKQSAGKAGS